MIDEEVHVYVRTHSDDRNANNHRSVHIAVTGFIYLQPVSFVATSFILTDFSEIHILTS